MSATNPRKCWWTRAMCRCVTWNSASKPASRCTARTKRTTTACRTAKRHSAIKRPSCLRGPDKTSKLNRCSASSVGFVRPSKSAFRWLPEEQCYQCPEGHRLLFSSKQTQRRVDYAMRLNLYTCPPEHCLACPRQKVCTRSPHKGRSVSRMENEELLDALRARMETDEARRLYKLRSRTVELNYADLKEHR